VTLLLLAFVSHPQQVSLVLTGVNVSEPVYTPVPAPETETDQEINDLGIEDAVIRELARALQPRRGGQIVACPLESAVQSTSCHERSIAP
jgi:hypothetical protein